MGFTLHNPNIKFNARQHYEFYGASPLFVVTCWLIFDIVALFFFPNDLRFLFKLEIGVLFGSWLLSIIFYKTSNLLAPIGFVLIRAYTLLGEIVQAPFDTCDLAITGGVWLVLVLVWRGQYKSYLLKKGLEHEMICPLCKGESAIKAPAWGMQIAYVGKCYVCLGKGGFRKDDESPHWEGAQLLEKYQADHASTQAEFNTMSTALKELKEQAKQGELALGEQLYRQTLGLIQQYEEQAKLRRQQLDFFEEGMRKLHRMMYNSFLAENMLAKQKALVDLREDNTTDLGTIMARKEQLQMHYEVLDRIKALSIEIDMHETTSIAKDLRKEIKEMQGQL